MQPTWVSHQMSVDGLTIHDLVESSPWYREQTYRAPVWYQQQVLSRASSDSSIGWMTFVGGGMVFIGGAMLVPGPVDVAAGAAGVAIFKHPVGAIVGIVAYNLLALAVMGGGYALIKLD